MPMIEESGLTPMELQEVCSEAGKYAVFARLLEEKASEVNFPYLEDEGFIEVFSLCIALLANYPNNKTILQRVPRLGFACHDRRTVKDETDVLYHFPIQGDGKEESLVNMALLYLALEFGMANSEPDLAHLPFLFSIVEEIRAYVHAGYELLPAAKEVEDAVRAYLDYSLPSDLYDSLMGVKKQFDEIRKFIAKHEDD